jgi:hypothetical protein
MTGKDRSAESAESSAAGRLRDRDSLNEGPVTFRDHFISIYQSIVGEIARKIVVRSRSAAAPEAVASGDDAASLVLAAERIAKIQAANRSATISRAEGPGIEAMSVIDRAQVCASLGWQLLEAKARSDTAGAQSIEGELTASTCDPLWAETIDQYVKYYLGPGGGRREPLYVTPDKVESNVITIKSGSRIGLIGDWGTGAAPARRILEQVRQLSPDVLVHLGDIYYSGTESECSSNFEEIVDDVFERSKSALPVYTLAGNHDMYCGGVGYYELIKRLNKPPMVQEASFFCLRAEDESWQLLAMDTGQHDYSPFSVNNIVTFVGEAEQEWHRQRLQEFSGKTILLSHHQLFSAFSQIGKPAADGEVVPYNPRLQQTCQALSAAGNGIAAWFWGHEHNLCVYAPYLGLKRGRCLGHGAIPVFAADNPYDPLPQIKNPPGIQAGTMLSVAGELYTHGFALLSLNANGVAAADYYEDLNGTPRKLYSETID